MKAHYVVQFRAGGQWVSGMVIEMETFHLSAYLTILGRRRAVTRLLRTRACAAYYFDGTVLTAKEIHEDTT